MRKPLTRETLRETLAIPARRTIIVAPRQGRSRRRCQVGKRRTLPRLCLQPLAPGGYALFTAIFVDGNATNPSVSSLRFESR